MTAAGINLRDLLAAHGGELTFAQFMQQALYAPEFGYYSKQIRSVGRQGDFATAATLHPILAQAVAHWVLEYGKKIFARQPWHIIEIGPGSGQMAQWIQRALPLGIRWRTQFHLVEISPVLREQQRKLLAGRKFHWHAGMNEALQHCAGRALIYSNEVADAFPCIQLVRLQEQWQELVLRLQDGEATEQAVPPRSAFNPEDFSLLQSKQPIAAGQRIELHESYRSWLASWSKDWLCGAMLTIDYGDLAASLYQRRPRGSVRAYFQHLRQEGAALYQRVGRQDITADVNFTDLRNWGEQQHCRSEFLIDQREFIHSRVPAINDAAAQMLTHSAGAGQAFKVLCQSKGSATAQESNTSGRMAAIKQWAHTVRRDVHAVWLAAHDPRTPWFVKILALAVAAYAISPIDLIPDFIPLIGYLDDVILVPLGICLVVRLIPPEVMAEHRTAAAKAVERPINRWAAGVIIAVWIAGAVLLGRIFL